MKSTTILKYIRACLILTALTVIAATSCRRNSSKSVELTWLTMGTFASLTLRGIGDGQANELENITKAQFEDLNNTLSVYKPDSEISQLNTGTTGMVHVSKSTFTMLQETLRYAKLSEGAFDPTMCPLIKLWGFSGGTPPTALPTPEAINSALSRTGYPHLKLSKEPDLHAGFDLSDMQIDLGGIAKGFAVDKAFDAIFARQPDLNGIINLGGNIRCLGTATPEREWHIAVRNPFDATSTVGVLTMAPGMSVATSGNYERFITIGDKRYAHIIDPRTGYPVAGMAGVTALSRSATEADAMSTALFVVGLDNAPHLLRNLPDTEALLIPDREPMELWVTPGFNKAFTPHPPYTNNIHILK